MKKTAVLLFCCLFLSGPEVSPKAIGKGPQRAEVEPLCDAQELLYDLDSLSHELEAFLAELQPLLELKHEQDADDPANHWDEHYSDLNGYNCQYGKMLYGLYNDMEFGFFTELQSCICPCNPPLFDLLHSLEAENSAMLEEIYDILEEICGWD